MKSIILETSSLCGANCIMCPRGKIDYFYGEMKMDIFKKAVDEANDNRVKMFIFGGLGDPLMDSCIEEKLVYIKHNYPDVMIGTTTTGHLLNSEYIELICKYVDHIKISNYGFSKKSYESIHRGVLIYEDVFKNINNYLESQGRPYTTMGFLDLPQNQGEMDDWKNYYEHKADQIDIWRTHNWGGLMGEILENTSIKPCFRAIEPNNLVVRANGLVSLCCMSVDNRLIIGDIKKESIQQIISSDRFLHIQKIHKECTVLQSDLSCKGCDQILDRAESLLYTNNLKIPLYVNRKTFIG